MISEEQLAEWEDICADGMPGDFEDGIFTVISTLINEVRELRSKQPNDH